MGRGVNSTGYFASRVDDFRKYANKVLSLEEIQEIFKGRLTFFKDDTSEGSGGGGGGGNILNIYNQLGSPAGTHFNITYSKLTNGHNRTSTNGGDGVSAAPQGRFVSIIKGALSYYGAGGIGAMDIQHQ